MIYSQQIHGKGLTKEREYLEGWRRARAELQNYRQRVQTETEQAARLTQRRILEPLLYVADSFHAITQHVPETLKKDTWAQGVIHVTRQFDQLLEEYKLKQLGEIGEQFDPHLHEVIEQVEEKGKSPGTIAQVIHHGYRLGDFVIRPAKVKVFV